MTDIVSPLIQWLNANPELAGLATFIISAGESVAIVGTIVPGSITMTAIGTLAGAGVIPLWGTLFWATLGAIVGDGISYWLGHYFKDRIRNMWPFKNNPGVLHKGEAFVHKYGVMSVFIGRFVGPVRALVPVVAGMLGMKPLQFTIANVTSAIGWAPAYMLPGILLGAASLELPPDIALHVIMGLFLFIFTVILCVWIFFKIMSLIHKQLSYLQDHIWQWLSKHRVTKPITVLLKHHDPKHTHGQLSLAATFIITFTSFLLLTYFTQHLATATIAVNDAAFHLFRGIRNANLDSMMIMITLLGQKQIILSVLLVISLWIAYCKQWRIALDTLLLGIFAAGSVYIAKNLLQIERPWGIAVNPETYSMPSGHTTLAVTIFLGLAFLITRNIRPSLRWPIYIVAILLGAAVSISRLYLGAHWFTDVFGAWLLSFSLVTLIMIAYQRKKRPHINPGKLLLVAVIAYSISLPTYYYFKAPTLHAQYAQVNWPTVEIQMKNWWKNDVRIPAHRASLFGFPSQRINIEWAGDINDIRTTLLNEGWSKPPARDVVSTIHRIADISSAQYLPLISPQYLDKKPELILTRTVIGSRNEKSLMVIRLWDSNRVMKDSKEPLWVGIVGLVPRSYSWITKRNAADIEIGDAHLFPSNRSKREWQAQLVTAKELTNHNRERKYQILLVKPKATKK